MTYEIKQSSTQAALLFFLVQSSDHITALTGASPTVTISKNGAAFASPSGAVTEIANGWYKVAGNATDTNTLGPLALHATATSGDPCDILVANIVAYDPQDSVHLGLTCLPNTAVTTNASLLTSGTGTDQLSVTSGRVDAGKILGTAISTPATAGVLDVNVKNMNNVAATSITTINANQGTTQPLNFTGTAGSALVKSDMVDVAGAAVSATTAQLGVNVVNWNNAVVASPNVSGVPKVDVVDWLGSAPNALRNGRVDAIPQLHTGTAQAGANGSITLAASGSSTDNLYTGQYVTIDSSTGANQTRLITGYTGSTKVATVSPNWITNPTSASTYIIHPHGYVAAVTGDVIGNVEGNVNGSVASVTGAVGSVTGAVGSVTGNVGGNIVGSVASVTAGVTVTTNNDKTGYTASTVSDKTGYALTSAYDFAKGTVAMTESYAAAGATMSPAQALYQINQHLGESSISSTTKTVKKRDSSTTAKQFTLDSATTPTSITETT